MYAFFSLSTRHTIWKMAYHGTTRRFEKNMPILFLTLSKNMHQVFRDTHKIESWKNYHENVSKLKCIKLIFNPSKRPGFYHCKRWTVFLLRKKASNSFSQGLQNIVRLDQKSLTKRYKRPLSKLLFQQRCLAVCLSVCLSFCKKNFLMVAHIKKC